MRSYSKYAVGSCLSALLAVSAWSAPKPNLRLVDAAKDRDQQTVRSLLKQSVDVNARRADGATALMWAVNFDDAEMVDLLIKAGAKVNVSNVDGAAPLWLACHNGNAAITEKLLQAGADPNAALPSGETPLMAATETNLDVMRVLLSHQVDVNKQNREGQTALMGAVVHKHPDMVRQLIDHGANVNTSSKEGFTPLMYAVQQSDIDAAKVLIAAGANVNDTAHDGSTAVLIAAFRSDEPLLALLLDKGANPNVADHDGYTALHYAAARRNMVASVKALLAHGANPNVQLVNDPARRDSTPAQVGATPLFLAAYNRNPATMRILVVGGADPKIRTTATVFLDGGAQTQGRRLQIIAKTSPLLAAAGSGRFKGNYTPISEAEQKNAIEAIKIMLEQGADINETNDYGQTALHAAAYLDADVLVQFLVDHGSKIDAVDKYQQTPLSIAEGIHTKALGGDFDIQPRRGYEKTPKLLVKLGAKSLDELGIEYLKEKTLTAVSEPVQ